MPVSRRRFLGMLGGAGLLATGVAGCGTGGTTILGELLASQVPLPERFRVPLPVPPVARPVDRDASADYYELVQRPADVEILPGLPTRIWGYDGIFPGPTIESRSHRRTVITHRNELPVPVTVHLHGGHTPAEHDGYPTELILPAAGFTPAEHTRHGGWSFAEGSKEYVYPLEQQAATLWYHDHRMDFTGPQVYRGLAGFHIVRDDVDDALPLPKGDKDIPLMITDRAFAEDGSFAYPSLDPSLTGRPGVAEDYMEGVLGDVILVNGAPWPVLEVTGSRHRFRILNASNARRYKLALDPPPADGPAFVQVGSDGGLLATPQPHDELPVAAAERYDVVVDFAAYRPGTEVTLVNRFATGPPSEVMRFRVTRREADDSTVPATLAEVEPPRRPPGAVVRDVRFRKGTVSGMHGMAEPMDGWLVNGKPFDPTRMDARPRLGSTEVWRISSDFDHPFHMHLVQFQVLSHNGRPPSAHEAGWKDTVSLGAFEQVEVVARFTGYRGRYVFHCHNLEHEDMAMMGNFETV